MAESRRARDALAHHALRALPARDGELLIGSLTVSELAERADGRPFYAYDADALRARVTELRDALPADVGIHYAVKANPMRELCELMATLVDGFDVASGGELQRARETSMDAGRISFAGPGKRDEEIAAAIRAGSVLNLESERELTVALRAGAEQGQAPRLAVRVNPAFDLRSAGVRMGGGARPFGIDQERVPTLLAAIRESGAEFRGLQFYAGSQCLHAEAIVEAWRQTFKAARDLLADTRMGCPTLNIGGGFGIPYFPGEEPLDIQAAAGELAELVTEHTAHLPGTRVVLELGRYLVGEAGTYVCRIVDRKWSRGELFLVADGGLHHHLAASGNFGQVIRRNYPVCVANRLGEPAVETATIVGPLCTPLDIVAKSIRVPKAAPGDFVAVLNAGAYGLSASPTAFLGHPPPAEFLV